MKRIHLPDPEDKDDLSEALRRMLEDASKEQRIAAVEWFIVRHYLKGCRYFDSIEYDTGTVIPSYRNADGGVPFKYEELLNKANTEIGRLMRLDVGPAITRQMVGLDGLRKESVAQAVLNAIELNIDPDNVKREFLTTLVVYGCSGMVVYEEPDEDRDKKRPARNLGVEVIPPWEIVLLPASAKTGSEVAATARRRWVPLDWINSVLKGLKEPTVEKDADPKFRLQEVSLGGSLWESDTNPESPTGTTSTGYGTQITDYNHPDPTRTGHHASASRGKKNRDKQMVAWGNFTEVWVPRKNGRLSAYYVMVGDVCVHSTLFPNNDKAPPMPVGISVMSGGCGIYGRSFVAPMVGINAEVEAAIQNLLRNVSDLDLFGMLAIPAGMGVDQATLDDSFAERRKYFIYDPDPSAPHARVEHFSPSTSGDLPKAVVDMGLGLLDRLGQQPEIITHGDAPGRVDSTPALDYLYHASTVPLSVVASSIASAYGTVYSRLLWSARDWKNLQLNLETLADSSIIGLQFDYQKGTIDLSESVPSPIDVSIGIRSQVPKEPENQKQELQGLLQQGIISPQQFRIYSRLYKLDIPLKEDAEWENYRMAMLRNLIVFNDGETPGELPQGLQPSEYDIPDVHLMVLTRLASSPEFALASTAVQESISKLIEHYQGGAGKFPEELPYPEEEAAGGVPGGMMPPGMPGMPPPDLTGGMQPQLDGNMEAAMAALQGPGAGLPDQFSL